MLADSPDNALSKDLMLLQLGQVDLLMAMYASDNAIALEDESSELLESVRYWAETDSELPLHLSQPGINLLLTLDISDQSGEQESLQLKFCIPLIYDKESFEATPEMEPPAAIVRVQQPHWMNRAEVAQLNTKIPGGDTLTIIEYVKEAGLENLRASRQQKERTTSGDLDASIVRVWFYFPSISTRSKRDDLVKWAPSYGLTGFLLAGKPGILCLEGRSVAIDDFMRFIKTESWGDIPPQHKKVSERYREVGSGTKRVFEDMREITDMIGERRGERANRSDMKALEAWLVERGLGEAFEKVLL